MNAFQPPNFWTGVCLLSMLCGAAHGQTATSQSHAAKHTEIVKLLDAGNVEGRKTLRFRPTEGTTESLVLTTSWDIAIELNAQPIPKTVPPLMRMAMRTKVEKVTPAGEIHTSIEVTKAEAIPTQGGTDALLSSVSGALASTVGMKGKMVTTDRGIVKSLEFVIDSSDPTLRQYMESIKDSLGKLTAPFPAEPVGVGARWEIDQPLNFSGWEAELRTTYTLAEFTPKGAHLTAQIAQSAKGQDMKEMPLPAGTKVRLMRMSGSGKGSSTISFDSLVPPASEASNELEIVTMIIDGDVTQELKQTLKISMTGGPEAKK